MNRLSGDQGRMAAILGLGRDAIDLLTKKWEKLVLSNTFPVKDFFVLSGPIHAIEGAIESAKSSGAKIAKKLKIQIASHHPEMMAAPASEFEDILPKYTFSTPISKFIMDALSDVVETGEDVGKYLALALLRPVELDKIFQRFIDLGGKHLVDIGPGNSISKHAERGGLSLDIVTMDTDQGMQQLAKLLGK